MVAAPGRCFRAWDSARIRAADAACLSGPDVGRAAPPVGLAVTSMVLGIVSILFCPCSYGLLSIPIATVAVLMGVISIAKKRGGKGFAIAGISTGVSALPLG